MLFASLCRTGRNCLWFTCHSSVVVPSSFAPISTDQSSHHRYPEPVVRKPVEWKPPVRTFRNRAPEEQKLEEEDVFHAKPVKYKPTNNRLNKQRDYEKGQCKPEQKGKEIRWIETKVET